MQVAVRQIISLMPAYSSCFTKRQRRDQGEITTMRALKPKRTMQLRMQDSVLS
jgi:hypothetical protein